MAKRKVEVEIIGRGEDFERAFGRAQSVGSRFGRTFGKVVKAGAVVAGAALAGLGVAAKIAFDELNQSAKVGAQTAAVLKSTGGAAKVSAKQVESLAQALMTKTGIDDEVVQSGENVLLTFTRIRNEAGKGNDIFDQTTKATLDLSVAMGKDLTSSAVMVGKAMNDPIRGMTALRRVGVQFTEAQEAAIKKMVETGDVMGAQKLILEELNREFGGSAVAAGQTLPGQLNILKESVRNLLAEGFAPLIPAITAFVQTLTANLPQIQAVAGTVFAGVATVIQGVGIPAFQAVRGIAAGVVAWFQANWPQIRSVGVAVLSAVGNFIRGTLIPAFIDMKNWVTGVVRDVARVFREHKPALTEIWNSVKNIMGDVVSIIRDLAPLIKITLVTALKVAIPVVHAIAVVIEALADALAKAVSLAHGLVNAIRNLPGAGALGDLLGREHGGPVSAGRPYIVGEGGPELFVPRSSGSIVPNGKFAGVTLNVYPTGAASDDPAALASALSWRLRTI